MSSKSKVSSQEDITNAGTIIDALLQAAFRFIAQELY